MGSVCSIRADSVVSGSLEKCHTEQRNENSSTQYTISASILCSAIWNPYRVTRDEAEKVLQNAYAGAFIFSHSITSEIFLSVSTGKYVCHHPVLRIGQYYEIGGRNFNNIEAAVKFYRINPLGDALLTEQFNSVRNDRPSTAVAASSHEARKTPSQTSNTSPKDRNIIVKRVTFENSCSKDDLHSSFNNNNIDSGTDNHNNHSKHEITTTFTTHTDCPNSYDDDEEALNEEDTKKIFQKLQNKPRKSICRVQPQDSLSTSSGIMFKEEEF